MLLGSRVLGFGLSGSVSVVCHGVGHTVDLLLGLASCSLFPVAARAARRHVVPPGPDVCLQ